MRPPKLAPLPGERPPPVGVPLALVLPPPQAASHARFAKGLGGFHLEPYAKWREAAAAVVQATWRWAPVAAHTPVVVKICCLSERPAKRPGWCPQADWRGGRLFRPVRPDIENFAEAVLDALMPGRVSVSGGGTLRTRGALEDDASVVRLQVEDLVAAAGEPPATLVWVTVLGSLAPAP